MQQLEDGVGVEVEAVFFAPLQIADPGRDLRQFVGVGIDLDVVKLLGTDAERYGRQVFVRAFVFPVEMIAEINVGETFLAAGLHGCRFKGEVFAGRIIFNGRRVADQAADIVEVGLRGGGLFELDVSTLINEFLC
ncbi:MAG: hypothetical protein AB8I52_02470 [Candidatus Promineifilaceae bacterium]